MNCEFSDIQNFHHFCSCLFLFLITFLFVNIFRQLIYSFKYLFVINFANFSCSSAFGFSLFLELSPWIRQCLLESPLN